MIEVSGTAQKQAWLDRVLPPIEQVRPLVWSVPVECPRFPVRFTLAYLVANATGEFVLIDPGWDSPAGRVQLEAGLRAAGLDWAALVSIVSTHFHPDHLGMVEYLSRRTGAPLGLHPRETAYIGARPVGESSVVLHNQWLRECGVPEDVRRAVLVTSDDVHDLELSALPGIELRDDTRLPLPGRDLRVVFTPGHTSGHVCLVDYDNELVFTGDHVLPRITPNVGLGTHDSGRDALAEYFDSLDRMAPFASYEVCPAHEYRFRGLAERVDELREHHDERSRNVAHVARELDHPSVWEVARRLPWARPWAALDGLNLRGALAETAAHLHYLSQHADRRDHP